MTEKQVFDVLKKGGRLIRWTHKGTDCFRLQDAAINPVGLIRASRVQRWERLQRIHKQDGGYRWLPKGHRVTDREDFQLFFVTHRPWGELKYWELYAPSREAARVLYQQLFRTSGLPIPAYTKISAKRKLI